MQEVGADVHITGSHLTNETEFTVVLSGIYIAALTGVPPAAETGYRLAQPVTPETVYCPTLAGRRSKPRNLILCLARAGIEPTTSSTIGSEHTTTLSRQAIILSIYCLYIVKAFEVDVPPNLSAAQRIFSF